MANYEVILEVAGPLAMFTRPDTGGTPTSYPVPTWSAAKAILESIAFFSDGRAWIEPTKVEICRRIGETGGRISYQRYTTNYGGPLRKASLFGKGLTPGGSSMQLFATVLANVCYRLYGEVVGPRTNNPVNAKHYLQDLFNRRICYRNINKGGCFRTPALGWSEFVCRYWGPPRTRVLQGISGDIENVTWKRYCADWNLPFIDETEVDEDIYEHIPSMLDRMWSQSIDGEYAPSYRQDARIEKGTLHFLQPKHSVTVAPGEFSDAE